MGRRQSGVDRETLARAVRYLGRYRWQAIIPYVFLVIATMAQLMVPRMLGNIIDAVSRGTIANAIVPRLDTIPADVLDQILEGIGITEAQLVFSAENAERICDTIHKPEYPVLPGILTGHICGPCH